MRDLKRVYRANTQGFSKLGLDELAEKWEAKYPVAISYWWKKREKLTTFFQYTRPIWKLIFTTNAVDGFLRQLQKVMTMKCVFTSEMLLLKLVYLASLKD